MKFTNTNTMRNNDAAASTPSTSFIENAEVTCQITAVELSETMAGDIKAVLRIDATADNGEQKKLTDCLFLNPNYEKRINAIYASMALNQPNDDDFDADVKDDFAIWLNRPFRVSLKRNKGGYICPYMFLLPNTSMNPKYAKTGFGVKEGKAVEEAKGIIANDYRAAWHLRQNMDSNRNN